MLETFLLQANKHNRQKIACGIADTLLKNIPVPVVFFYRKSFDHQILIDSLKEVLNDFPVFAGRLEVINNSQYIDCNNQGVLFSVASESCTIDEILQEFPSVSKERLINLIDSKTVIKNKSPIFTIKLTRFTCGGMVMGICWHHSIGDMHTFACLMKAWSNTVNKKRYGLPLIVEERENYLQDNLTINNNSISGVRYLNLREMLGLAFYMLVQTRKKISLRFYFSEDELENMKHVFSKNTNIKLSKNDVLCAHLFSIISELDNYDKERFLSIAINYRSRMNLPDKVLGNFVSSVNILVDADNNSFNIAKNLRVVVNSFQQKYMDYFATKRYIDENGGIKNSSRFVSKRIDPVSRTLFVSNWSNFDIYDIEFGESKPFFFSYFGKTGIPWLSIITEGFMKEGLIYSVILPDKLGRIIMQDHNLRKIHQYRSPNEIRPDLLNNLEWLL